MAKRKGHDWDDFALFYHHILRINPQLSSVGERESEGVRLEGKSLCELVFPEEFRPDSRRGICDLHPQISVNGGWIL